MASLRSPEHRYANHSLHDASSAPDSYHCEAGADAFLRHEPILDSHENLVGYELATVTTSAQCSSALPSWMQPLGPETARIADQKVVLIPADANSLRQAASAPPPSQNVILAIRVPPSGSIGLAAELRRLSGQGFLIALDDYRYAPDAAYLLDVASYVRLDASRSNALELAQAAVTLLEHSAVGVMVHHVRARDEFDGLCKLPFHYFQGPFFTERKESPSPHLDHDRLQIIELLNMVRRKAELAAIEKAFRRDPALAYRLLRYINSPGVGLRSEVRSITHALVMLGYEPLYRWLALLLFAAGPEGGKNGALLNLALVRGRLIELLGQQALPESERDSLFVVGVFSLLEPLLGIPLKQALTAIHLPQAVDAALLEGSGIYGSYLRLAMACESGDAERIRNLTAECQLDAAGVNAAHLSALLWAESLI
jgi:EAL and modified HD-GYP domain-containing signal transduction protein